MNNNGFIDFTKLNSAVAYIRVSSQKQSETSLDTQLDTIKRFAQQNQLSLTHVYRDKITASGTKERDGFNGMISDALEGKFNIILVYKYDRFHRDNVEEQNILRRLESNQIFVLSVTENIDTTTPAGRLLRWIMSGVNRFYIENLQQEIYDKTTKVALKAYFMGGVAPYGFKIVTKRDSEASRNRKLYAINEEEAPAVQLIFSLYAQGYSYISIVKALGEKGFRTRSNTLWSIQTIRSMLRNEKYKGTYVFRKGTKKQNDTHREDTIRLEDAIPRIVTPEIFERVQERIRSRQKIAHTGNRLSLLSGRIFCGDCGAKMHANTSGTSRTYICSRYNCYRDVPYTGIGMNKADRFILGYLRERHIPKRVDYTEKARVINEQAHERNQLIDSRIQALKKELRELKEKLDNAKQAVLSGNPLKDEIMVEIPVMRSQGKVIQSRINELRESRSQIITEEFLKRSDDKIIQELNGGVKSQLQVVHRLVQKVLVYRSGYIEIIPKRDAEG
jgi:DNA invertase Pin-like site-specific DNA recombinase